MTTTTEIKQAFDGIESAEIEYSDLAGGVRVSVPDSDAGAFFKTLRVNGFDAVSKRLGDTLVAHIRATDDDRSTLEELFS